ncbi:MAG: ParB/RepB/Spo0J family partition protein [Thermoguttaceae bacterium]
MMSKDQLGIRPINDRRFARIPIDKIIVVNSRQRDEKRFLENIRSISELGMYKPICVNESKLKKTGKYELVCGEGRIEACRRLGITEIEAEIINVSDEHALLLGLAENLTRAPKNVIEFARRLRQMYERGVSYRELGRITGRSAEMMRSYVTLMQQGEERLIRGVENGIFTISFAIDIVNSPLKDIQKLVMDLFLDGKLIQKDFDSINAILNERASKGLSNSDMTTRQLKSEIRKKTKECKRVYEQGKIKRDDVISLKAGLDELWNDVRFSKILDEIEGLKRPELKGLY